MAKKILIIHYRVGKTDGVSLEISNWKEILKNSGNDVETCGGPYSLEADYIIENLEHQLNDKVYTLNEEAFGGFKNYTEVIFTREYEKLKSSLYNDFCKVFEKTKPDAVIVSNLFSVGENISAAPALFEALNKFKIPTVAVHHDFWWENLRYSKQSCKLVKEILKKYLPPHDALFKHAVINRIAKEALAARKGIYATILHDCLDFSVSNTDHYGACRKVLAGHGIGQDDIIVLQATRIVHRKNIETAMDFVSLLSKWISETNEKRLVFVMAGYAEKADEWYREALLEYAKKLNINIHIIEPYRKIFFPIRFE